VKKSTKAVLLSALVFPGTGHLYLRKYLPALLLAGVSIVAVYYWSATALDQAMEIVGKIESGEIPPDSATIEQMVSQQGAALDNPWLHLASIALLVCWVVGILDAYRVGRVVDRETAAGGDH